MVCEDLEEKVTLLIGSEQGMIYSDSKAAKVGRTFVEMALIVQILFKEHWHCVFHRRGGIDYEGWARAT
jgi:hypothetical protein